MTKLLKQKDLSANDKIIIITIFDNMIFGECTLTSQDIANATGLSRKKVINNLDKLIEMDYIKCIVKGEFRSRKTIPTLRLLNLLNYDNN